MGETRHSLRPRSDPALLSLVLPAFNEEEMIPHLRERLAAFFLELPCPCEVIFVNDGSTDRTLERLLEWSRQDPRIKVLSLARNFGHQLAVTAGIDAASGDAVVIMDADLQDPPSAVLEMLARYREGYHVVYGQRSSREGDSAFKRLTAWGFYRLMRKFVHDRLPADTGDFRLVSRDCLLVLREMRETHRFLRGMVAWVGFAQTAVRFARPRRVAGETKYPLRKMLRFAWTAAVSFSPAPLRLALGFGLVIVALVFGYVAYAILLPLAGVATVPGWSSEIAFLGVIGGAILISVGVLGEYVGRIFEEIKGRPLYIVAEAANIEGWDGRPTTRAPETLRRSRDDSRYIDSRRDGSRYDGSRRDGSRYDDSRRDDSRYDGSRRDDSRRDGSRRDDSRHGDARRDGHPPAGDPRVHPTQHPPRTASPHTPAEAQP